MLRESVEGLEANKIVQNLGDRDFVGSFGFAALVQHGGTFWEGGERVRGVLVAHHGELVEVGEGGDAVNVVGNGAVQASEELALLRLSGPLVFGNVPAGPAKVGGANKFQRLVLGFLSPLVTRLPAGEFGPLGLSLVLLYIVVANAALVEVKPAVFPRALYHSTKDIVLPNLAAAAALVGARQALLA